MSYSAWARFRLSGQYACPTPCHVHDRLLLFSIDADDQETEGLAYSTVVSMPSRAQPLGLTFQLPLRGHPVRYPFDRYSLLLGVISEREFADGRVTRQGRAEAAGAWYLTFQEELPRLTLSETVEVDPASIETVDDEHMDLHYAFVHRFTFQRPAYLRVLALLLRASRHRRRRIRRVPAAAAPTGVERWGLDPGCLGRAQHHVSE